MEDTLQMTTRPEVVANHQSMVEKTDLNAAKLQETLQTRKKAKLERFGHFDGDS